MDNTLTSSVLLPYAGSGVVRIDSLSFLAGCRKRRLKQALSVSHGVVFYVCSFVLFIRATFCVSLVLHFDVFCPLVVLVKLSVLAK